MLPDVTSMLYWTCWAVNPPSKWGPADKLLEEKTQGLIRMVGFWGTGQAFTLRVWHSVVIVKVTTRTSGIATSSQVQLCKRKCLCVCVCVCTCKCRPLSGGLGSGLLPGCAAVLMMRVQLAVVDPICAAHSFCLSCHGAVWRLLVMNNIPEG